MGSRSAHAAPNQLFAWARYCSCASITSPSGVSRSSQGADCILASSPSGGEPSSSEARAYVGIEIIHVSACFWSLCSAHQHHETRAPHLQLQNYCSHCLALGVGSLAKGAAAGADRAQTADYLESTLALPNQRQLAPTKQRQKAALALEQSTRPAEAKLVATLEQPDERRGAACCLAGRSVPIRATGLLALSACE